jgi:hypothetical protein
LLTSEARRWRIYRASRFTQAITRDIEAANEAGIVSTVISEGIDGWACDMIELWLEDREALRFQLVLHMHQLQYGMSATFYQLHYGVFWSAYDPKLILHALKHGPGGDASVDELIEVLKDVQDRKDIRFDSVLSNGRSEVAFTITFPPLTGVNHRYRYISSPLTLSFHISVDTVEFLLIHSVFHVGTNLCSWRDMR